MQSALEGLLEESRRPASREVIVEEPIPLPDVMPPCEIEVIELDAARPPLLVSATQALADNQVEKFNLELPEPTATTSPELGERILALLHDTPDLKAREIARELGIEKGNVNFALYGTLAGRVVQVDFRWRPK